MTKRVLIVDDATDFARMIASAIATLGPDLAVKVVPSAEEALLEITSGPIDLLIVDVRLPGISGLELTRKIRAHSQTIKVIQITGMSEPRLEDLALGVGADAFFHKPMEMTDFLEAARRSLGYAPPAEESETDEAHSDLDRQMAGALSGLRHRIGALAVILLDERGHPVAQAGELPDAVPESNLTPALLCLLSASVKAGRILSQPSPSSVTAFEGAAERYLIAPVAESFALLALIKIRKTTLRLAIAFEEMLLSVKELEGILATIGVASVPGQEKPAVEARPADEPAGEPAVEALPAARAREPDFESLLKLSAKKKLGPDELDAFWEGLATSVPAQPNSNPDMLSFEQASKLGLAPKKPAAG
jgi:CheY-like chemotaxis protein